MAQKLGLYIVETVRRNGFFYRVVGIGSYLFLFEFVGLHGLHFSLDFFTQYLIDEFGLFPIPITRVNLPKIFSTLSPVFSKNTTLQFRAYIINYRTFCS